MCDKKIELVTSPDDVGVGYLYLLNHPGRGVAGCVKKQINIREIIENYNGPDLYLDFNGDNELIGVEILE